MQPTPSLTGHGPQEPATADLSGRCVGNSYVLVCPVGHGATGTVWRGIDRSSGEAVAVKLLHEGLLKQPKLVIRFVQERTILMMMRHENIVGVRDLFSVGGSLALVMDYVAGGSLRTHLRGQRTLAPSDAADVLAQVAAALAQAHELGVVHRDVKPDNILLQDNDGRLEVRLTDFGIARVLDTAGLTTPQAIVGTPHYMAPEAISGDAEPASDLYAVGVVLFELVTGHPPYAGEPLAVLHRHLDDTPVFPPGLPQQVRELIEWCMAKDPALRPTAAELGIALRELSRQTDGVPAMAVPTEVPDLAAHSTPDFGIAAVAHPSVRRQPARRRPRNGPRSWMWRRPGMMVALLAGVVALSGVTGFNAWRVFDTRDDDPAIAAPGVQPSAGGPVSAAPSARASAGAATVEKAPAPPLLAANGLPSLPSAGSGPGRATAPSAGPGRGTGKGAGAGSGAGSGTGTGSGAGNGSGPEVSTFGPWRCGDSSSWDLGHPILARPCYSLGPVVRVLGQMEAFPGLQLDISLTIRDAKSDEVVAGPFTCESLMFTDFAWKQNCGPADLNPPHGGRYVVAESWEYTQRPLIPGGIARGPAFDW